MYIDKSNRNTCTNDMVKALLQGVADIPDDDDSDSEVIEKPCDNTAVIVDDNLVAKAIAKRRKLKGLDRE
jgi:hypothetical protein